MSGSLVQPPAGVTRLDPYTVRVRASNPSPMTLDGTNTYLLRAPGSDEVVVVDPGPALDAHRGAVEQAAGAGRIAGVVVTHHHADHAEAAGWAQAWQAPLWAGDPDLVSVPARPLADGQALSWAGLELQAVATAGHSRDHVCLRVPVTGAVLTGDHVLGQGTTMVGWPDGDMAAYMASLRRLATLDAKVLYPGHGPVVDDPAAVIAAYLAHRVERELQVLAAWQAGERAPARIVARVYAGTDPALHPAAERSVRAHLAKLQADGRIG